jgi:hypothetical protein
MIVSDFRGNDKSAKREGGVYAMAIEENGAALRLKPVDGLI